MFRNKILYSPSQPFLFLTEARGSGWELWLPGLVGASDSVSHIQGMVSTLLGFAAGVSGAPGATGSWVPRMSRVLLVS